MLNLTLEQVKAYAKEYKAVPVAKECLADMLTPLAFLNNVRCSSRNYFLLESIEGGEHWARYSFVGYDPELLVLTTRAFRLYGLSFLIMGYNIYASSFFTALGDGITSALISFLRTLLFQVAAVLVLPELLGIDGVWLAVTAAELASLAVSFAMFRQKDRIFHYRSE